MKEDSNSNPDYRLLKARSAVRCATRKLKRLGYDENEAIELMRATFSSSDAARHQPTKRSPSGREVRLKRAQIAIRQSMRLGHTESDIAYLAGVTPGAIAHILSPEDGRSVSELLVSKLEGLLPNVKVLATCNTNCARIDEATHAELETMVTVALNQGLDRVRFPDGVSAFLATVGDSLRPVYVMLIEKPLDNNVAHLKQLAHEVKHILDFVSDLINQTEKSDRRNLAGPADGRIA